MEQLVEVYRTNPDGTALVRCVRLSACSGDCHKCAGCGASGETIELTAQNPIGAHKGDLVVVQSQSAPVLAAAAVLYLCPLAMFFAAYLLGNRLRQPGELWGTGGFFLGLLLAWVYDRRVVKKRKTVYTITGYGNKTFPA